MLPATPVTPGATPPSEHLEMQGTSGAAEASSVHDAFLSYMPSPSTGMEHDVSQPILNASSPTRPVITGVALMLALFVATFLVLRCFYHISTMSSASKGASGRRLSDHGRHDPCDAPQDREEQQQQQQQQQDVAGAAGPMPEAVAGAPSGAEAAASAPSTPSLPAGYSSAVHLDLLDVYGKSTYMNSWLSGADDAASSVRVGGTEYDEVLRDGVKFLAALQAVTFAGDVGEEDRQEFLKTLDQCRKTATRLAQQREGSCIDVCEVKASSLRSRFVGSSRHLEKARSGHLLQPSDPELQTMMGLREAVKSAQKVYDDTKSMFPDFFGLSGVQNSLKSLSAAIQEAEDSLMLAANACADSWTRHLKALQPAAQAEGAHGERARQKLIEGMDTAKQMQTKLRYISGKAPSL
ncbi:uncharacterized protein EMH_0085600 [Eimeria mitis]|uniref:Uncharacterized protein n=1 Tax=Eimeria mitis TaxID=44415 RepID=U6KET4_9EIME|nr:uncharacterized protein EMH_0085600 [Eimeria mitis]CDJ36439.1 hypothetical protein, conserved [Eimeria mitis]